MKSSRVGKDWREGGCCEMRLDVGKCISAGLRQRVTGHKLAASTHRNDSHWASQQLPQPEADRGWWAEEAKRPMDAWVRQKRWRIWKCKFFVPKSNFEELALRLYEGISDYFNPTTSIGIFLGILLHPSPIFQLISSGTSLSRSPSHIFRQRHHALTTDDHYSRNTFQRRMHPSK